MSNLVFDGVYTPLVVGRKMSLCLQFVAATLVDNLFHSSVLCEKF